LYNTLSQHLVTILVYSTARGFDYAERERYINTMGY